jgi:hypothetical protein
MITPLRSNLSQSTHCVWLWVHHTFDWISESVLDIHHYSLLYTPCWSRSYFWVRLDLVLQSEYNFCLSPSGSLLPQSEYTFCLNTSRPYILQREREREGQLLIRSILFGPAIQFRSILFGPAIQFWTCPEKVWSCSLEASFLYHFTPTLFRKNVYGQFLIRSILVLLFNFEVPLKKFIKKKQQQRMGFVCVFLSFVWWCIVITFVSRLMSLA